jgi:uncharacterized integral membrane protein
MSTAPTNKPPMDDPWAVSAQPPAAGAGVPRKPKQTSAQQAARLQRVKAGQAKLTARMTWPLVVRMMLAVVAARVVMAGVLIAYSLEDIHLHSLLVSRATTFDQWEGALHTARGMAGLNVLFALGLALPTLLWARVRAYVAKLPGVAPHPMQRSSTQYRVLNLPAYWPPVPEGTPSWTRRIHWRVPPGIAGVFLILLLATNALDRWVLTVPADRYELSSVVDLVAAALALLCAALDLVRLREYSRWPGRP